MKVFIVGYDVSSIGSYGTVYKFVIITINRNKIEKIIRCNQLYVWALYGLVRPSEAISPFVSNTMRIIN